MMSCCGQREAVNNRHQLGGGVSRSGHLGLSSTHVCGWLGVEPTAVVTDIGVEPAASSDGH